MTQYEYREKDYSYLKGTDVEIQRSDNEYNVGRFAEVLIVQGDSLRVLVDNGEEFWTDVDSVYHDPKPKGGN